MGLIGGILSPLYAGCSGILMSPLSFLQRPMRWLEAISRFRGTTSAFPNFALDLCVRKFRPQNHPDLDLSSWEVACNGAEPIRARSLESFARTFEPYGFRRQALFPAYGLAEGTLIVSGGAKLAGPLIEAFEEEALGQHRVVKARDESKGLSLVACGKSLIGQELRIVNPESRLASGPGEIGEIWVSGPSVAQGYWNWPAETKANFEAYLVDGGGPYLRTGDLGFLKEGELFVTGRLKDLMIFGGKNHYPQDIELTVEQCHPALRPGCGAAFSIEIEGEERLVVASELGKYSDLAEIARSLRRAVAERHELPVHTILLLEAGSIPKTSSGKIQRHACKAGFLANSLQAVAVDSIGGSHVAM
jgi:acyl-CoA synthetase (AMP-forming)/AMP-acid ligase II